MTSQLQEFFEVYRDHCVGVTGTKGKSTTSSLIFHLLKETGSDVVFAGNIGRPVFELRDELSSETQIVLELSSYQLESLTVSPHIAVWLNIFSEHLNYHGTFAQYVAAKSHITQFQTAEDILIYNAESPEVAAGGLRSAAQKQAFWPSHPLAAEVTDALPATVASVVRQHNLPAALLAVNAVTPLTTEQLTHALATFQPLAHRLETIGTFRGIRFVDDTLATIPEASISALAAFPETQVMLLGGFDRGIDYTSIVDEVVARHVPTVIFFRPSGEKMQQILEQKYPAEQRPQVFFAENMQEAVTLAYQHAQPGGVVLLSPASPSYGHFKNYEDKSAQFVQWVKQLAADAPET